MRTPDKRRDIDDQEANAQLPNRRWVSAPSKITILILAAAVAVFIFVLSNLIINHTDKKEEKTVVHASAGIPFHRTEIAPQPATFSMPPLQPTPTIDKIQITPPAASKPSGGSLFAYTAGDSASAAPNGKPSAGPGGEDGHLVADDDPLTSSLKASNIAKPAKAHILKNASRTIPRGTAIPCILKTRIDTSRPGLVVCDSKEEVRGWDGGVVKLLPRWTRFTGQISRGLSADQDRADVLWTSVLTTDNIEITVNSPGADMLGSPGLPGQVDNHIGEKIGAVLLYTAIEAGPALAVQALQNQSKNGEYGNSYNYNQVYQPGQGVAGKLLEQKLNRPPILIKNQGEEVMVMVAQNWDLSDVIELELVR